MSIEKQPAPRGRRGHVYRVRYRDEGHQRQKTFDRLADAEQFEFDQRPASDGRSCSVGAES